MSNQQETTKLTFSYAFKDMDEARMIQNLIEGWYNLNLEGGYETIVNRFYESFMVQVDNQDDSILGVCMLEDGVDENCTNNADHWCQHCGQTFCMKHKDAHGCEDKNE